MFFVRSMRVRTTECLSWGRWCDLKLSLVTVAVSSFLVNRHVDRAILLSGCFLVSSATKHLQ